MLPGRIFWNDCTENFHFVFRRCDWLEQLREYSASNELFVYSVTTTLPHPKLHDEKLYVKEIKFVENINLVQSRTRNVRAAAQRNYLYTTSQLPKMCTIFLLLLISVEPYRSLSALLTRALVNEIAEGQSKSKVEFFSATIPKYASQAHISEWFYRIFFVYSVTATLPHPEIDIRQQVQKSKSKSEAASNPDPMRSSLAY